MAICEAESVEATVLGTFTDTHRLRVFYRGEVVARSGHGFPPQRLAPPHEEGRFGIRRNILSPNPGKSGLTL